jgi:hypothetical protein
MLPVITYYVDYEYISKELCENIDKPELRCDGKCHLKKELANASEEDKPISNFKNIFKEIENILFIEKINSYNIISFSKIIQNNYWYNNLYQYNNSNLTFHPPSLFL